MEELIKWKEENPDRWYEVIGSDTSRQEKWEECVKDPTPELQSLLWKWVHEVFTISFD